MRHRLLGASHIFIGLVLLPLSLVFGLFLVPILVLVPAWMMVLGILLWRGTARAASLARWTHAAALVFALALCVYGIFALQAAARSASEGGGLLGTYGLLPLAYGGLLGILSAVTLLQVRTGPGR